MALNTTTMSPCSADNGCMAKLWHYTTTDTLATVSASGYFNGLAATLGIGDIIFVSVVDALAAGSRTALTGVFMLAVKTNNGTTVTTTT